MADVLLFPFSHSHYWKRMIASLLPDSGEYKQVFHTHSEVMQVLSDFDVAELKSRI
jgi:hypothetical protein